MPTQFGGDEVDEDYLDFIGVKRTPAPPLLPTPVVSEDEMANKMFDEYNSIKATKGQKAADDYAASVNRANKATPGLIGPGDPRAKKYPLGSTDPKRFKNLPQNRPAIKPFSDPSVIQGPDPKLPPMSMGPLGPDYIGSPKNPIIYADPKKGIMSKVIAGPGSATQADAQWAIENGVTIPPIGPEAPPPQQPAREPAAKPMDSNVDRKSEPYTPPTPLKKDDRFADDKFTKFLSGYQDSANDDRFIGRFGEAMATIGTQGKITPTQTGFFRDMVRDADKPTEEAMNALKLSEMAKDAREKADQYAAASDPNSEVSAAKRATLRAIYPMEASQIPNLDQLSAVEIDKFIDPTFKQGTLYQLQSSLGLNKTMSAEELQKKNAELQLELQRLRNEGAIKTKEASPGVDPNKAPGGVKPITPAQKLKLAKEQQPFVNIVKGLNTLKSLKRGVNTGVLGSTENKLKSFVGVQDKNEAAFNFAIENSVMAEVNRVAATTFTPGLVEQVRSMLPRYRDEDGSFNSKMQQINNKVQREYQTWIDSNEAAGVDMSAFKSGMPSFSIDEKPSPGSGGGRSITIDPDAMARERKRRDAIKKGH